MRAVSVHDSLPLVDESSGTAPCGFGRLRARITTRYKRPASPVYSAAR